MDLPKELLDLFGAKRTEIVFMKAPKVMIRFSNRSNDEIRENVTSIDIIEGPAGTFVTAVYRTESGVGTIGAPVEQIREIIVGCD